VPGSSNVFLSGMVAYSARQKIAWGVPDAVIASHGVISQETAVAMAQAARKQIGSNAGIGVTGVAGPTQQEEKPVGTVHIAVATDAHVSTTTQQFRGARTEIKWRAANTALNLMRLHLIRHG